MTKKLYYSEPGSETFTAEITEIIPAGKSWRVTLDRTCFYPEGGGQPADRGWINGIAVEDVRKEGEVIHHLLSEDPGPGTVKGKIDMIWRLDYMQQHTGQHIVSGALWRVGKYKTVSVHMGSDHTTIEIDAPEISDEDLAAAESMANTMIRENLPLDYIHTSDAEVQQFQLRKPTDLEGSIRLVRIDEFDCVACGGLHVARTGLVGLVKAVSVEKIRGHARIAWKIGDRAFRDYETKSRIISALKTVLATREDSFVQRVTELDGELSEMKKRYGGLETRLADLMSQRLFAGAEGVGSTGWRIVAVSWMDEEASLIKRVMKNLLKKEKLMVCLLNRVGDRLQWNIGSSTDLDFPFDDIKSDLLAPIEGRGGGRPPLWQGTGFRLDGSEAFLTAFRELTASVLTREPVK